MNSRSVYLAFIVLACQISSLPLLPISADEIPAELLTFSEFFDASAPELRPSSRLLSLNGKRVRIVGFMAEMEVAPIGAFYLCPRPVFCDEAGGGTADLPVDAVRVIVPSLQGRKLRFIPGRLEATGVLELGYKPEGDGQVSTIRLILESEPKHSSGSSLPAIDRKEQTRETQKEK